MKSKTRHTRASAVIVVVGLAGVLVGCGAASARTGESPAAAAASAPTSSPLPTADPMEAVASVDLECGQLDALNGILFRTEWQHDHGKIDDAAYAARLDAVQDGWASMLVGDTSVTPKIEVVQRAAVAGVSADAPAYQTALAAAVHACEQAGAAIGTVALPEMGG